MDLVIVPVLVFAAAALGLSAGMLALGALLGPKRAGAVKQMPYESGVDPIHGARRRFDVRFHLVAIAFLVFDVELLFLYPWAVANKHPAGLAQVMDTAGRNLVFAQLLLFLVLLTAGLVYAWRKGIFRWR